MLSIRGTRPGMLGLLFGTLWAAPPDGHQLEFSSFAGARDVRLVASAKYQESRVRLTPAKEQRAGAAWYARPLFLRNGFDTTFEFQLTNPGGLGGGADGLALVLQNSGPSAIAGRGSAGGFAVGDGQGDHRSQGIPNSIAVFFDTHRNGDGDDPSDNYVAICTNGQIGAMRWPPPRLAVVPRLQVYLKDQRVHTARVSFKPPLLSIYLDDPSTPVLVAPVDLSTVLDAGGTAFVGFTASTGSGYANHDILSWSFTASDTPDVVSSLSQVSSEISYRLKPCLPDRNLCTPEEASVENLGSGRFHVMLPAHLEWGASIPNPQKRTVNLSNVHGSVCWDLKARGAGGCSVTGNVLITRHEDGKTYFSIRDEPGSFEDNQGFLEFDVILARSEP